MNIPENFSIPLVSVGIPVFNGAATISRTINNILNQDYANLEVIVCDNASTDETWEIVCAFSKSDSRIRIMRNNFNRGSIFNFNRVFQESIGKYFMWAAHDDIHNSEFISSCVEALESDPQAVLCAPRMQMTLPGKNHPIWVSSMSSFINKKDIRDRYKETLKHFPAVSIYGLMRSDSLRRTNLMAPVMGGDLLAIQELSLQGHFIGLEEILFTRCGRLSWNTVDDDYRTFFGKQKMPGWYSPFVVLSINQYWSLSRSSVPIREKIPLLRILILYIGGQFFLKLMIKTLGQVVTKQHRLALAQWIYWKFLNGPNITATDTAIFLNRIIKPRFGWDF